mgnify:CR=1 FL=1
MQKMNETIKREIFRELCQHREELKTDISLVQKIINERLDYIPHQKLYKFRSCSINNFKTLEENIQSLDNIIKEGIQTKINMMPDNIRFKLQNTLMIMIQN